MEEGIIGRSFVFQIKIKWKSPTAQDDTCQCRFNEQEDQSLHVP